MYHVMDGIGNVLQFFWTVPVWEWIRAEPWSPVLRLLEEAALKFITEAYPHDSGIGGALSALYSYKLYRDSVHILHYYCICVANVQQLSHESSGNLQSEGGIVSCQTSS
jgi:hypothetical protein